MDDIIVIGSDLKVIQTRITTLYHKFSLKDLVTLHYILGIGVHKLVDCSIFLYQKKYNDEFISQVNMLYSEPINSLMGFTSQLFAYIDSHDFDGALYRIIVDTLQCVTLTRLDLAFRVNKACQFISALKEVH